MPNKTFIGRWKDYRLNVKAPNYDVAYSMLYDILRFKLEVSYHDIVTFLRVGIATPPEAQRIHPMIPQEDT